MAEEQYTWTDNPTVSGVSPCNTDILNDCLMHLKYDKKDGGGTSLPLFTPVIQDHILEGNDAKGYALQGTYVYKESAPERYGYPDFYNKCVEEKSAATEKLALKLNVTTTGSPTINNGVISGFTTTSYAILPSIPSSVNTLSMQFKFTTGNDVETTQIILGQSTVNRTTPQIGLGTGGYLEFITSSTTNVFNAGIYNKDNPLQPNTTYTMNVSWNGEQIQGTVTTGSKSFQLVAQTDRETARDDKTSSVLWSENCQIGADVGTNPFLGSIDLKECYININGQRWWTGATVADKNPNGHVFYDIADKAVVDEVFQKQGVAWMYGVDTENERIFLPRNNYFIQATVDTSEVGEFNEAGIPNLKGTFPNGDKREPETKPTGVFKYASTTNKSAWDSTRTLNSIELDASLASSVYRDDCDTVQPPSVSNALYIVVGNTEETQAITDVTEITTSENDTIPLFTGQYFDFKPNNPSWLKAGTQQNSGGIYTSCYNTLINCLEEADNIYDLKVIETSEMIVGVDYSEYWKVNQDEMYFITPTKLNYKALNGGIKGNGIAVGFNTLESNQFGGLYSNYVSALSRVSLRNEGNLDLGVNEYVGLQQDSTKSGIIAEESTSQLYFKVANAVQNLELLDAGEVLESLADKIGRQECISYVTETYQNGSSRYVIWSPDHTGKRRCQQFGTLVPVGVANAFVDVPLLKEYEDSSYSAFAINAGGGNNASPYIVKVGAADINTPAILKISCNNAGTAVNWWTEGYLAEEVSNEL